MPYIKQPLRYAVAEPLNDLIRSASVTENAEQRASNAVSMLVALVAMAMRPDAGWRYHYLHRAFGVFMAAGVEYIRRKNPALQAAYAYDYPPNLSLGEQGAVSSMVKTVRAHPDADRDGYLNYIVSAYTAAVIPPEYVRGVLTRAGMEFYNTFVSGYENEAIQKNGDIAAYSRG